MTKLQNYDGLDLDEGRMCGGAAFVKLMKKTNCLASSTKKYYGPRITSSSSFTSQESSNIEYDPPPKAQFRMPNQIGEPVEEAYKLDFKLQADFQANGGAMKLAPRSSGHCRSVIGSGSNQGVVVMIVA